MVKDVKLHVQCYEVCQRVKVSTSKPASLLEPLPVADKPWLDISMDFIEGLLKSHSPFSSLHSYESGCSFYEKCVWYA